MIFVRHGETEENAGGVIQGQLPGTLSQLGRKQAKLVAKSLSVEEIDYVYSSDLARAAETAQEIAKFHAQTPIQYVRELRERGYGAFQGRRKSEFDYAGWQREVNVPGSSYGGAETLEEVRGRLSSFLMRTEGRHGDQTVLLVGHGAMGRVLVAIILGKPLAEAKEIPQIGNASISTFEFSDGRYEMLEFNDTRHLDSEIGVNKARRSKREDF